MASPQVAGAIGFLHSVASPAFVTLRNSDPAGAALALKTVILQSVDPLPALAGKTVSGGSDEIAKWLLERQAQSFDAIFVPAGGQVAGRCSRSPAATETSRAVDPRRNGGRSTKS